MILINSVASCLELSSTGKHAHLKFVLIINKYSGIYDCFFVL